MILDFYFVVGSHFRFPGLVFCSEFGATLLDGFVFCRPLFSTKSPVSTLTPNEQGDPSPTYDDPEHGTCSPPEHRRLGSTGRPFTALFGANQCLCRQLLWTLRRRDPHRIPDQWRRQGRARGTTSLNASWALHTCYRPWSSWTTWLMPLFEQGQDSCQTTQTEDYTQGTSKTATSNGETATTFSQSYLFMDSRWKEEASSLEGRRALSIFLESHRVQARQDRTRRETYVAKHQGRLWVTTGLWAMSPRFWWKNSSFHPKPFQILSYSYLFVYHEQLFDLVWQIRYISSFRQFLAVLFTPSFPIVILFSQHHVTALSSWSILLQSRHGPWPYISATAFKIPLGTNYDHDDCLSVSSPPWMESAWTSPTSTYYLCVWPQADATTCSHQFILQHPRTPSCWSPFYTGVWRLVPSFESDLPGLRRKLQGIWSSDLDCWYISTSLVDPSPEARLLPIHRHRPGHRPHTWWNAWPSRLYATGLPQLVLPHLENSPTSQRLHCSSSTIAMHYASPRLSGHRLHGPSTRHALRTSLLLCFIEMSRPLPMPWVFNSLFGKRENTSIQYRLIYTLSVHWLHFTLISPFTVVVLWYICFPRAVGLARSPVFRILHTNPASCHGNHSCSQWRPLFSFVYTSYG